MEQLIWNENKINELNNWIVDDNASSIAAVLAELESVVKVFENDGRLIIAKKAEEKIIRTKETFKHFIAEWLINSDYFINKI